MEGQKEEYKKGYKGFVLMMAGLVAIMFLLPFIPNADAKITAIVLDNIMNFWMALLTWIIYITEKVYWYTGLSYEEALKAGSSVRKRYAMSHFQRFAAFAAAYVVYSLISCFFSVPFIADIMIETIGIVVVAISTMNIKLK